jgi:hypothetical protein
MVEGLEYDNLEAQFFTVGWNWTWKDQMKNIELQVYM